MKRFLCVVLMILFLVISMSTSVAAAEMTRQVEFKKTDTPSWLQTFKHITITIKVERGDCLCSITQELNRKKGYHGCSYVTWRELYNQNRDIVGANPDLILPNMVLTYKTCKPAGMGVTSII